MSSPKLEHSAGVRAVMAVAVAALLGLAGCSGAPPEPQTPAPSAGRPHYKIGRPYEINGKRYYPKYVSEYEAVGVASWYGDVFHGRLTANGETYDMYALTAAHPTLPLPSVVEVTNLDNGRRLVLRVNDRGPFVDDRLIDLSFAAAEELGFTDRGLTKVWVRYLGIADLEQPAIRPGEERQYVARSCQLPEPETLVC